MSIRRTLAAFIIIVSGAVAIGAAQSQSQARITRIEFTPGTVEEGGGVWIGLIGTGNCTFLLDFGDGQSVKRTADLPDRVHHKYEPDKAYDVVATPEAPCEGVARAKLDVRPIVQGIWGLKVEPAGAADMPSIVLTIEGKGMCTVLVEFGDTKQERIEAELPARVTHAYPATGQYEIRATTAAPCRGEARVRVDVKTDATVHSARSTTSGFARVARLAGI